MIVLVDLIFFPHYNTAVHATPVVLKVCSLGQPGNITWVPLHTFWNRDWLESNHLFFHKPSWWIWCKVKLVNHCFKVAQFSFGLHNSPYLHSCTIQFIFLMMSSTFPVHSQFKSLSWEQWEATDSAQAWLTRTRVAYHDLLSLHTTLLSPLTLDTPVTSHPYLPRIQHLRVFSHAIPSSWKVIPSLSVLCHLAWLIPNQHSPLSSMAISLEVFPHFLDLIKSPNKEFSSYHLLIKNL